MIFIKKILPFFPKTKHLVTHKSFFLQKNILIKNIYNNRLLWKINKFI
jgi:hypothetical protein